MNFIIRLLITAAVAYGLSFILDGIHIEGYTRALLFAFLLSLLNCILKPILVILTFPITIVSLGLFLFVINALMIMLADRFVDGFKVDGFWWAVVFSLLLSVTSSGLYGLLRGEKQKSRN